MFQRRSAQKIITFQCVPAAGPRKPLKGYAINLNLTLIGRLLAPLFGAIVGAGAVALSNWFDFGFIDLRFSTGQGVGLTIVAFILNIVITDFFYYWMHRFQHESPILWQEHKLHHMDQELCALIRESPLEPLVTAVALLPMAIVFKVDPMQGAIGGSIIFAWGVFIHSNIRVSRGPLNRILTSPQLHRIHHSRQADHFDCNYAVIFPFWDVLFGTYYHPKGGEYPQTGVHDEKEVDSTLAGGCCRFGHGAECS